jgi:hypothetical protein
MKKWQTTGVTIYFTWGTQHMGKDLSCYGHGHCAGWKTTSQADGAREFAKYIKRDMEVKQWKKQSEIHAAKAPPSLMSYSTVDTPDALLTVPPIVQFAGNGCECSSGEKFGMHTCYARCCGTELGSELKKASNEVTEFCLKPAVCDCRSETVSVGRQKSRGA